MKRIFKNKFYTVIKITENESSNCGILDGETVQGMLKNFTFDNEYQMYFNKNCSIGYEIKESE